MVVNRRLNRRDFLASSAKTSAALAMSGSLGSLLAACASGGTSSEASTIAVEVDEGHNAAPFQWFNPDMKSKFGVDTKIVGLPFVGQYEKIVSELITRSNVYDVLVFPPQFLGDFAAKGFLHVLTEFGSASDFNLDDVLPVYRDPNSVRNGKMYAASYDGDILQVAMRKDLADAAGIKSPPTTWDEFVTFARELHRPPAHYGTAFYGQRGFCYAWFINVFAASGGKWFDEQMKPGISGDQGVAALQTLINLKQYAPPNILQIGYPELNDTYVKGQSAMVVQWDDLALHAEDPGQSQVVGKTTYAPCPGRSYMAYSRIMAISAFSSNPHNSYKVIQYMNSANVSVKDVYDPGAGEDPFRTSHFDPSKVKTHDGKDVMTSDQATSYVNAIKGCLTGGYPELSIPGGPRYLDILDLKVNEALSGTTSAANALKAVESEWNSITDSLGKDSQVKAYADWVASFQKAGVNY